MGDTHMDTICNYGNKNAGALSSAWTVHPAREVTKCVRTEDGWLSHQWVNFSLFVKELELLHQQYVGWVKCSSGQTIYLGKLVL